MIIELTIVICLLVFSAIFSASESAIFSLEVSSLTKERRYQVSPSLRKKVILLISWVKKPEKILVSILFANILTNIILTHTLDKFFLSGSFIFIGENLLFRTLIITTILLLFGEIIPKVGVLSYARQWSLWITPFLHRWSLMILLISKPVLVILDKILLYFFPKPQLSLDRKELLETLEQSHFQGILPQEDERKLRQYIYFQTSNVYSIMIPKTKCFIIHHDLELAKVKQVFLKHFEKTKISFAFVYDSKKERYIGYVGKKELFLAMHRKEEIFPNYIQPLLDIPSTLSLTEALERFMRHNQEVGLVLGEDGRMTGSIELKQVLNTLIGSQNDRHQSYKMVGKFIRCLRDNIYEVSGETTIEMFNQYFSSDLYSDSAKTINGFVIQLVDGFPKRSTVVEVERYQFKKFLLSNGRISFCNVEVLEQKD